ncbi:hypothetical protein SDC9_105158 [bioreactor metagenome]|uniref:Competence protein CoiA nuclease-like domain-containing protein n=1 Tax=bioreactor metagenome TaxID=1076179 RepID=A0A645AYT0_9ZZZZ
MTLIATIAATGKDVESFTTPPDIWAQWRKQPIGTFVIGRHRTPAVLKRSPRGLQFFAAAPGEGGVTAPESIEHQIAKIQLVQGMRAAGYEAKVEYPGSTPSGEEWQADVFVQAPHGRVAIEVQMSQQHWDDYRSRTARYKASGVFVVWLIRGVHHDAVGKSRIRYLMSQGLQQAEAMNHDMDDMPCIPLDKPEGDEDGPRVIVYPKDGSKPFLRLSLESFGAGVAAGALEYGVYRYSDGSRPWPHWMWDSTKGLV